jgi:hypothetical protein
MRFCKCWCYQTCWQVLDWTSHTCLFSDCRHHCQTSNTVGARTLKLLMFVLKTLRYNSFVSLNTTTGTKSCKLRRNNHSKNMERWPLSKLLIKIHIIRHKERSRLHKNTIRRMLLTAALAADYIKRKIHCVRNADYHAAHSVATGLQDVATQ